MQQTLNDMLSQLGRVSPLYALAALFAYCMSHVVNASRWRLVLVGLGRPVPLRETFLANLCSIFMGNVTPGRVGGEICRVVMLQQRAGVDAVLATVSQGYDRLT